MYHNVLENPNSDVSYIIFSVPSPQEILKRSVCEITETSLKNDSKKNSMKNTVYDPRMGALGNSSDCETCKQPYLKCNGHEGHIELEIPIIHPKFFKTILLVLRCVCENCSRLLLSEGKLMLMDLDKYNDQDRLKYISEKSAKVEKCDNCDNPVPTYIARDGKIKKYYEKDKIVDVTPSEIHIIFLKIPNKDYNLLGFNQALENNPKFKDKNILVDQNTYHRHQTRPEYMILTVLSVLPPCDRPYASKDGEKSDDDLTDKYISIVKCNMKLRNDRLMQNTLTTEAENIKGKKKKQKLKETERKKIQNELEEHIKTLIDNRSEKSKISGGRAHKCFNDRLAQKEGQMRKHIMGKRCLEENTKVLMYNGKWKMIKHVKVGEKVVGDDGKPREVLDICYGYDRLYKVSDGEKSFYCNFLHTHTVLQENKIQDLELDEIKDAENVYLEKYINWDFKNISLSPKLIAQRILNSEIGEIPEEYIYNIPIVRITLLRELLQGKDHLYISSNGIDIHQFIVLGNSLCLKTVMEFSRKIKITYSGKNIKFINDSFLSTNKNNKITVEKAHIGNFVGLQLDGNSRFVIENFIVTHNCNFSARTVIGGGPTLRLGTLGVPDKIAKVVTMPVFINASNIRQMQQKVKENKINYVWREGRQIILKDPSGHWVPSKFQKNYKLKENDVVERELEDGDYVLFNRQPTLRVESMLGMQVKIIQDKVFRFSLANTGCFNADFDGDYNNLDY